MALIAGREIKMGTLNETQAMLIMREGSVLRSDKVDNERRLRGIATILDIIESTVDDPDDLEFLLKMASIGKIGFAELLHLVAPNQEETPKTPVRRAARKR